MMCRSSYGLLASTFFALVACLFIYVPKVEGAALSTVVPAREKACFYAWVDQPYEKVGFYFAVQEGGNFDIDYVVHSPSDRVVLEGDKSSQEDFVFTANEFGQYSFCFESHISSHDRKLVDFDITVESEPRLELPLTKAVLLREQSTPVEDSMSNIDSDLTAIERTLRYFRMRENQGYALVETTRYVYVVMNLYLCSKRILRYSIIGVFVMIAISATQVFLVEYFFSKGSSSSRFSV
ncbi:erp2-p24 protein involved in membrane trafficking [Malassezia pachydermatis]|uniref:Erp2-p24 protein involved in membrane trafficking n=1 Tax=Malassezia pachydermatis TaxID=77020 RepID=A0A0M8MSY3_9BASI|nr:erp2-p24 protein involved in membrane trafficking [Malassezia pachydermatis]KOS13150.1 erp2-p24 protein involved in membrane trafficking [Malassezia pachydermatis]